MDTVYYRIQRADRDPAALLESDQRSTVWAGTAMRRCESCNGQGSHLVVTDPDDYEMDREDPCEDCGGAGEVEDVRSGVSVCQSYEALRDYFAAREATLDDCVLVALRGEPSEDEDFDADAPGAPVLVHPTEIVSVSAVDGEKLAQ